MHLTLVRHGQTRSNVTATLDSALPGPPLTRAGCAQASDVAAVLREEEADAVYASTHLRALQTAGALAAASNFPVHVRSELREVECGEYEGRSDHDAVFAYWSAIAAWVEGRAHHRISGGESGSEALGRFDAVVADMLAARYRRVIAFSHGALIRAWVGARVVNAPENFLHDYPLRNTGVVTLQLRDPGWMLVSWDGRAVASDEVADDAGAPASAVLHPMGIPITASGAGVEQPSSLLQPPRISRRQD